MQQENSLLSAEELAVPVCSFEDAFIFYWIGVVVVMVNLGSLSSNFVAVANLLLVVGDSSLLKIDCKPSGCIK